MLNDPSDVASSHSDTRVLRVVYRGWRSMVGAAIPLDGARSYKTCLSSDEPSSGYHPTLSPISLKISTMTHFDSESL